MPERRPLAGQERADRDQDQQQRLDTVLALLDRQVRQLRTGEQWAGALRQAALLPGQSFTNVLLIASRHPGATTVAGYEAWKALGRQVTRGQQGIEVLAGTTRPARRRDAAAGGTAAASGDGDQVRTRLTYVWDITQTTGPATPEPGISASPDHGPPARVLDALAWAARREGFAIERENCGNGPGDSLIFWNARRIRVRPGLPAEREAAAISHQLGHITLHRHLAGPPCATAGACEGILRLEADSVAHIICARYAIPAPAQFPPVASWAGADPRANPGLAIRAAGARITSAASRLTAHLTGTLPVPAPARRVNPSAGKPAPALADRVSDGRRQAATLRDRAEATAAASDPAAATAAVPFSQVLADAGQFYLTRAPGSWVPAYLRSRGLDDSAAGDWRIGYAPAGWTTLLDHLRALGHSSAEIEAAGLARRSARGTLIDHFRDRAMFAIRDEHGTIAGYIGRARPGADQVPKYLNSPRTASYSKGDILPGLHHARPALASGAVPVLVEGPFDAIAITSCAPGQYAGLAACGTALTARQVAALSRLCDLDQRVVIVASDGDQAGREAAIRAYHILRGFTFRAASVAFPPGEDPAAILQSAGPAALARIMRDQAQPLARLVIEAEIDQRLNGRHSPHEALLAMRGTALVIAGLLPDSLARDITALTGGQALRTWDDDLRPANEPAVERVARLLTGDAPARSPPSPTGSGSATQKSSPR